MRLAFLLAALIGLFSCASLTEEECQVADWYDIGVTDGAEGRGTDRIEAHRRSCADIGVTPDLEAWLKGRTAGLRLYCTPEKAYRVGRDGRSIAEGCTAAELRRMEPAYETGRMYWRIGLEIDDLRSEIRSLDSDLAGLPAGSPALGTLLARRSMLIGELRLAEMRQRRYATWP